MRLDLQAETTVGSGPLKAHAGNTLLLFLLQYLERPVGVEWCPTVLPDWDLLLYIEAPWSYTSGQLRLLTTHQTVAAKRSAEGFSRLCPYEAGEQVVVGVQVCGLGDLRT